MWFERLNNNNDNSNNNYTFIQFTHIEICMYFDNIFLTVTIM